MLLDVTNGTYFSHQCQIVLTPTIIGFTMTYGSATPPYGDRLRVEVNNDNTVTIPQFSNDGTSLTYTATLYYR